MRTASQIGIAILVVTQMVWPATAQTAAAVSDQTVLHLSGEGSVEAAPDQLVADLLAKSTSPSAASVILRDGRPGDSLSTSEPVAKPFQPSPGPGVAGR